MSNESDIVEMDELKKDHDVLGMLDLVEQNLRYAKSTARVIGSSVGENNAPPLAVDLSNAVWNLSDMIGVIAERIETIHDEISALKGKGKSSGNTDLGGKAAVGNSAAKGDGYVH